MGWATGSQGYEGSRQEEQGSCPSCPAGWGTREPQVAVEDTLGTCAHGLLHTHPCPGLCWWLLCKESSVTLPLGPIEALEWLLAEVSLPCLGPFWEVPRFCRQHHGTQTFSSLSLSSLWHHCLHQPERGRSWGPGSGAHSVSAGLALLQEPRADWWKNLGHCVCKWQKHLP